MLEIIVPEKSGVRFTMLAHMAQEKGKNLNDKRRIRTDVVVKIFSMGVI